MMLAADLGGTHLRIALGDGRSEWHRSAEIDRPVPTTAASVVEALMGALKRFAIAPGAFSGVGLSVAGLVDSDGVVRRAENLGWAEVPVAAVLQEAFGLPVAVDTDVFCGALFETRAGAARTCASALYVAVGTGIGHAFVCERKVWRGASGAANAMGHVTIAPDGPPCYCGGRGCLCLVSSGKAQAGDDAPPEPLEQLALVLANATTLLEPEIIIVAGGALRQPWFDLAGLRALVDERRYRGTGAPDIVVSTARDPNLRGAAMLLDGDLH